jgi:aminoglycoside phosphotransferase (APT) family kinase protein
MEGSTLAAVCAWLRQTLGAREVEPIGSFGGSTTASVRVFNVRGVRGARGVVSALPVVVKCYDRPVPGVDGAHLVFNEARGLTAAEQAGIPAPLLLAVDADGARIGAPALAMTVVHGEVRARPGNPRDDWIDGLASMLVRIADASQPSLELPAVESWRAPTDRDAPPEWVRDPAVWRAAVDRVEAGLAGGPDRFIHRDYHPLNVVWEGDSVSAVVDWVNASDGPIEYDLSRCRVNIALVAGADAADEFLAACGDLGRGYDPAWDLETVFSFLGNVDVLLAGNDAGADLTPDGIRSALDAVITAAVRS